MDRQLLAIHTQRPPLPAGLIVRPRLIDAVADTFAEAKVVLVAAPAGSGKTSLLVAWAHRTTRPVVWLTIEEDQTDPIRFLRYFHPARHCRPRPVHRRAGGQPFSETRSGKRGLVTEAIRGAASVAPLSVYPVSRRFFGS